MIELRLLALARLPALLFQSSYGWIEATRVIAAEREPLFEFLSDLENHWLLADGFVEVPGGDERSGGEVQLRGPLGLRRKARTTILVSLAPRLMIGRAHVGRRTVARINWVLSPYRRHSTQVTLSAVLESVGLLDGVVLVLGGRRWLERRFGATLDVLAGLAATLDDDDRPRPSQLEVRRCAGRARRGVAAGTAG